MQRNNIFLKGYNFIDGNIFLQETEIDYRTVQGVSLDVKINDHDEIVTSWVTYVNSAEEDSELFAQRIDSDGALNGEKIKINNGSDGYIDDANLNLLNNGDYSIVWYNNGQNEGENGVFERKCFDNQLDSIRQLNSLESDFVQYPSASMNDSGNYVVIWYNYYQSSNGSGVYGILGNLEKNWCQSLNCELML